MRWPTAAQVGLLRPRERNYSKLYLGVQRGKERTDAPPPLMVGQHYALVAGDAFSLTEYTLTFNAAGMIATASDIRPNMTVGCGTLADPFLYGSARILFVDVATNRLCLEPNTIGANGNFALGEYIWIDGVSRLYRKLPYIDAAGVIYEDGNPNSTGGAGIPGLGIAWPGNANYYNRPVALMGSPRFAWTNEPINFYGFRSHGRGGNAIVGWQWGLDGGVSTGAALATAGTVPNPIVARWPSAGEYNVTLTVTDNSGKGAGSDAWGIPWLDHVASRPVLVFDRPGRGANPPYTEFKINSLSGRYGSGWSARITVFGTADKTEFPDNALIILFAEDWYGGTQESIGGWYGQEGILFVGHIRADSVEADYQKSTVTFQADTIDQWMRDIDLWPSNFISGGPNKWLEIANMMVEDCCWYISEMRSNLKDVTDCFFCSDPDGATGKLLNFIDLTEASLYDQLSSQVGSCFFGKVSASRHSSVHLFKHKNMMDLPERLIYGAAIHHFTRQDWHSDIEVGDERMRDSVAQVDFIGFYYDGAGNPRDLWSLAPARQTNFGMIEQVTGILLNPTTPQAECNVLSGLYRAWKNIRFPHVSMHCKNYRILEPATLDYFSVSLASTIRNLSWAAKQFITTGVSYKFNNEKGTFRVDIEGEASTWGPEGVGGEFPDGWDGEPGEPGSNPSEYFAAAGAIYALSRTTGPWLWTPSTGFVQKAAGLTGGWLNGCDLKIDPHNYNVVDGRHVWIATAQGPAKSTDNMETWELLRGNLPQPRNTAGDSPAPTLANLDFYCISFNPDNEDEVYLLAGTATRAWVFVTFDGGTTWSDWQGND